MTPEVRLSHAKHEKLFGLSKKTLKQTHYTSAWVNFAFLKFYSQDSTEYKQETLNETSHKNIQGSK